MTYSLSLMMRKSSCLCDFNSENHKDIKWLIFTSCILNKIFKKFNKNNSGITRTPLDSILQLPNSRGVFFSYQIVEERVLCQIGYSRVIGTLIYLMSYTRPDIT